MRQLQGVKKIHSNMGLSQTQARLISTTQVAAGWIQTGAIGTFRGGKSRTMGWFVIAVKARRIECPR
jgi:hypothetical protein